MRERERQRDRDIYEKERKKRKEEGRTRLGPLFCFPAEPRSVTCVMWHQHCMLLCTRWHEHPDWPVTIATLARIRMRRPRIGVIENIPGMELVRAGSDESALSLVKKLLVDMQCGVAHCSVDLSIFHRASRARTLLCCANVVRVCVCVCVRLLGGPCVSPSVSVCLFVRQSVCLS